EVQERDLVFEGVRQGPARAAVRGAGQGVALVEQPALGGRAAAVGGRVAAGGRRVAVAVQEQGAVPAPREVNQVGRGPDAARVGARLGALWRRRRDGLAAGGQPEGQREQRGQDLHRFAATFE